MLLHQSEGKPKRTPIAHPKGNACVLKNTDPSYSMSKRHPLYLGEFWGLKVFLRMDFSIIEIGRALDIRNNNRLGFKFCLFQK